MNCRHCGSSLKHTFLDLGFAPPSNAYLTEEDLNSSELYYPLKLNVCTKCWLVQTEDYAQVTELFSPRYAYFSSTSSSWMAHAKRYCEAITQQLKLDAQKFVIEIASNDGYLLRNFLSAGIPCLGIEPTASTADAAERLGIPVLREFFGERLAKDLVARGRRADLIVGNNVYAHVPDINDFTRGLKVALKPAGTITLEFPHLFQLIQHNQFDTAYHEHFSYLSLHTVTLIFQAAGMRVFDVQELPTHGGSLRVFGAHNDDARSTAPTVQRTIDMETAAGLRFLETYKAFQHKANAIKNGLLSFLIAQQTTGTKVAAYGAAAKGNTLLNYAGIKPDLLPYVCDAAPAKQGKFLPGSHIPIFPPLVLKERKPDVVLIMPWNIAGEIAEEHSYVKSWGGRFVVAVPSLLEFG